ncbi:hypothetical protein PHLCEN_2v1124 [Hermanssonia centrifuga]|uniref:Uncharacterized protein n=1 Tax=Hermanssonia centrifuga TaxID=98765 RepID=A0A2R6S4A7_9APHY|nr:hypothetical protein PHLCEN_2v1124 [Hermanssonia centrifuga]
MNGNSWIPHPQQHYSQPYQPLETPVAVDSVHDAHRLLGSYPFASATPSTHGESTSMSIWLDIY